MRVAASGGPPNETMALPATQSGRAVVTGAAGALGQSLVECLSVRGFEVLGMDRVPPKASATSIGGAVAFQVCDVATARFEELVRPGDVVFHLAAYVHRLPRTPEEIREVHEVNHHATARLAAACLAAGATLVFVSTIAVEAITEYGRSKAAAEDAIRALGQRGLRFSILRFPLLYGPNGRGNMERMLGAIRTGRYWPVGDQSTPKSCLYLDDAARALVLAGRGALGGTFVAAPDPIPTLGQIHAAAYSAVGRRLPVLAVPRGLALGVAHLLKHLLALANRSTRLAEQVETLTAPAGVDGGAFARETGFCPEVGLVEGMRRTARWLERGSP